jgi:hypothetical protein
MEQRRGHVLQDRKVNYKLRFLVPMVMNMKMTVFWYVTPCSLVETDQLIALMMEAVTTSETLINFYHTTGATSQKTVIFKLQVAEMQFLRRSEGKTRKDRIRRIYIWEELKIEEIHNQIERSRLRWFGHVKRMDEHRIPK